MKIIGMEVVFYHVRNQAQATQWYHDVLGLTPGASFPGWQAFEMPGDVRFAVDAPGENPSEMEATPNAVVCFRVEDLDAAVAELDAKGVARYGDIMDFGPVRVATLRDPDGNFIQLAERSA